MPAESRRQRFFGSRAAARAEYREMDGREQAWMEPMVAAFGRPAFQIGGGASKGCGYRRRDCSGGVSAGPCKPPHAERDVGISALAISHRAQPGARAPSPPDALAPSPFP